MRVIAGLAVVAGALASAGPAHADEPAAPDDPRGLFGLGGKRPPPVAPSADCDEPGTFGCVTPGDPLDAPAPYALSTYLPAAHLRRLPLVNATHDALAAYGLGVGRDEAGPVVGGASGLESRWTIEGAPADSVRSGGADTRVPLSFLAGLRISAGGFAARDRTSTGGTIDVELVRGGAAHVLEASVWGGLAGDARRRPTAAGSYAVRRQQIDAGPEASASLVAHGPLGRVLGGRAWYAAGVAPSLSITDVTWQASRLVDADGDGAIDGLPGEVALEPIVRTDARAHDYEVPALARLGLDAGPHHLDLTLVGQARRSARFLANATERAAGVDRTGVVGDAIATWRGRWPRTRAQVQLAWHRSDQQDHARDDLAGTTPQLLSAYVPTTLPDDPDLAARCSDATYPLIPQCPVPFGWFASAGAGPLTHVVGDRPTATAELAHTTGAHVLRVGGTLEDARLTTTTRLSGGAQQRSLFDGHLETLRFVDGDCDDTPGGPCDVAAASTLTYRTRYAAAFVQDTWSPEEALRVDGGLRWEMMWVGPYLHFSDQLAPRLGLSWDPLGGGRARVWTSMGRSFALLPASLGATVIRRDATVRDIETSAGPARSTDAGAPLVVADGIGAMAQDELTAGVEVGLPRAVRLTAWAQGRWLRRGLETTPAGFDNPGRSGGLPALRSSQIVAAELATAPTARLLLRVGYAFGRTVGNFTGPYDPRQGATLYAGDAFDVDSTSGTEVGALPTDLGHRLYVEAARTTRLGPVALDVGTRLSLTSGRPRSAFGVTDVGVVALIPRGAAGRGPMLAQANLRLAARWRRLAVTLEVFNAFDRSGATAIEEVYADGLVRPIEGGGYGDLVFLKDEDGDPARRRTAYGLPVLFQGPVAAVLGVHQSF